MKKNIALFYFSGSANLNFIVRFTCYIYYPNEDYSFRNFKWTVSVLWIINAIQIRKTGATIVNIRVNPLTNVLRPRYIRTKNKRNWIGKKTFLQFKIVGIRQKMENITIRPFSGNLNNVLLFCRVYELGKLKSIRPILLIQFFINFTGWVLMFLIAIDLKASSRFAPLNW